MMSLLPQSSIIGYPNLIAELDYIVKWNISKCKNLPCLKNHTSVIYKSKMIIFGGYDGVNHLNSVYIYDTEKDTSFIQETKGEIPKGRNGHTATVFKNKMYMIGGWLGLGQLASDEVYELDLDNFIWKKINPDPEIGPSNMHTADLWKNEIFIFRGGNGREYLNNLISYSISDKNAKILETFGKPPHVRANHASSIVDNKLFIFGGWSGTKRLNDLHSINLDTLQWCNIEISGHKPSPRAGTTLITYNNHLIIFGGSGPNSTYLNDLYFFDVDTQTWFMPNKVYNLENSPCERAGHSIVVDNNSKIYIYGGGMNTTTNLNGIFILHIDPEPILNLEINKKYFLDQKIFSNLKIFYNNPFLSDVDIIMLTIEGGNFQESNLNSSPNLLSSHSNETIFYGHKFILSLLCEKFKAMFSFGFEESVNQVVRVNYCSKYFEVILKYLYNSEIDDEEFSNFQLIDYLTVLKIADEYLLEEVKEWAQLKILNFLNSSSFFIILSYAKKYSADFLIKYCTWYHRHNRKSILISNVEFNFSELSIFSGSNESDNQGEMFI